MAKKPKTIQFIQPDSSGDTRQDFKTADPADMLKAEEQFKAITGKGFIGIALTPDGTPGKLLRKFDKTVERTMFRPQLIGG